MPLSPQRGNILFLILLAVVLFAALSYAVTGSMGGSGKNASSENVELKASSLLQYGSLMEQTVKRLMLTNGCRDTWLSFQYDSNNDNALTSADDYYNANSPADYSCHAYHPSGGGMTRMIAPADWTGGAGTDFLIMGRLSIGYMGSGQNCSNDTCTDLALILRNIPNDICQMINLKSFGANGIPDDVDNYFPNQKFTGSYSRSDELVAGNTNLGRVANNASAGCMKSEDIGNGISTGGNAFYYVLLAR